MKAHLVARLAVGRTGRVAFVARPDAFDAYGVAEPDGQALYLVRPDGVVAWRAAGLDFAACRRVLARFPPDVPTHAGVPSHG